MRMLMKEGRAMEEKGKFGEMFRLWVCKIGGSLLKSPRGQRGPR